VLSYLPLAIAGLMWIVNPDYLRILFDDEIGRFLIGAAVAALILAKVIIRKIVEIRI
jgi:tight adherence protein B